MAKEFITHEAGNNEAWICVCGNQPDSDGFDTCDVKGDELEPLVRSSWDGLYVCRQCGRIIRQDTLEVIGLKRFKTVEA